MSRNPRFVPRDGALVEVSTRTVHGRYLLRPTPEATRLILGIIGRAQKRYGVAIHIFTVLSNHYHFLLSVSDARQQAGFMQYINSNIAREIGRLVGWREAFWGRRYSSILTSDEPAAQLARFRYILAQGVKEHLVEQVGEWPGPSCARALLWGDPLVGTWIDRTGLYHARRRDESASIEDFTQEISVEITPLPCWQELPAKAIRAEVKEMVRSIETDAAVDRRDRGWAVLGSTAARRADPFDHPERPAQRPEPFCHAASREVRRQFREAFQLFLAAYRLASSALLAGDPSAYDDFPEGCFPPSMPYRPQAAPS